MTSQSYMQFFTRELYTAMQPDPDDVLSEDEYEQRCSQFEKQWDLVSDSYEKHLLATIPQLSPSMQEFADTSLHDGIVQSVKRKADSTIELKIEGTGFWGPRMAEHADEINSAIEEGDEIEDSDTVGVLLPSIGPSKVTLIFKDVVSVQGLDNIQGDWWLYEEVHASQSSGFDYRVLLEESELRIVANEIEFIDHSGGQV